MLIKWVVLENIRSYVKERIEFSPGSTLLSGDIGSGKSSILLAIEFALFGTKRAELSGNALLRTGKNSGSVELCLDLDGMDIIIKRILRRNRDGIKQESGYILMDGQKQELAPVELRTKIFELLGYPMALVSKSKDLIFRFTVYTPQEEMKAILTEDAEIRLDIIRRVFGIDRYKRIQENTQTALRNLKEQQRLQQARAENLEEKEQELHDVQEQLRHVTEQLEELEPRQKQQEEGIAEQRRHLEELDGRLVRHNNRLQLIDIKRKGLVDSTAEMQGLEDSRKTLLDELSKDREAVSPELKRPEHSVQELEEEVAASEKKSAEQRQQQATLTERKRGLQEQLAGLEKAKEQLGSTQKEIEQAAAGLIALKEKLVSKEAVSDSIRLIEKRLSAFTASRKEQELIIRNAEKIINAVTQNRECPMCRQPITDEHRHDITGKEGAVRSEAEQMLTLLEEREKADKETVDTLHDEFRSLEEDSRRYASLAAVHEEQQRQLATIKQSLDRLGALQKELAGIEESLGQAESDKTRQEGLEKKRELLKQAREQHRVYDEQQLKKQLVAEKQKRLAGIDDSINQLAQELTEMEEDISMLVHELATYGEDRLKKARLEHMLTPREAALRELIAQHASLSSRKLMLNDNLVKARHETETRKEAKTQAGLLGQSIAWLSTHFTELMAVMEKHILQQVYAEFNELFAKWFSLLVEDRLSARLDDSFSPVVEQADYELDSANLSGGEKTALALAYRLSLNRAINDFISGMKTSDLLILDEPTDGFSDEQLDKVRDVLNELSMQQIIIVSHESKVESFVENVISVRKEHHVSRVG